MDGRRARDDRPAPPPGGAPAVRPVRVLPPGPLLLVWAAASLIVQASAGLRVDPPEGRLTAAGPREPAPGPTLGEPEAERRLRLAYALLGRGEARRAEGLLEALPPAAAAHPLALRALGRCEKALGRPEEAAEAYGRLLAVHAEDVEALRFFLAYRWEEDDLPGALAVAARLARLGALDAESNRLARRIRDEWVARRVMARAGDAARPRD